MIDWLHALGFAFAVAAFGLGLASVIMAFLSNKKGAAGMTEKVEYGFLGLSGVVISIVLGIGVA